MSGDLSGFSLMELFRMEAESQTATLSAGLVSLETTSPTPEMIDPLMRAAHSLKGAARIVGLDAIVQIAHAMEDCFVAAQKGGLVLRSEHVDLLLRGVDVLAQVAQLGEAEVPAWQTEHTDEIGVLVSELKLARDDRLPARLASPLIVPSAAPVLAIDEVRKDMPDRSARPAPEIERGHDRAVRVTAESLTRLLGLAGEALMQSHRLSPLVDSLWALKGKQTQLLEALQALEDRFGSRDESPSIIDHERLAKAKDQVSQGLQKLGETVEGIEEFARQNETLSSRLHHEVLTSRMRPLGEGIRGFPRLVRDLARELGKQARFEVLGETTGVDRDILDRLEAPLNHLIRNAVDHGLETPEDRRASGKPAAGTVRLEARHRAGMLQITLSDDGRGIDLERLRAKVVERELTTAAIAKELSEAELLEFLFLPGFSTKEHVTEVSGRGVGLDVVHNMVRAVGGSVRVNAHAGKDTRFMLLLPITVSVIRALLVEIGGEPYAFPLSRIDRITVVDRSDLRELEGKPHVMLDDQPVGLVEASIVLELSRAPGIGERLPVVIASDRSHRFGVVVDRFLGERDLRVSPLDPRLGKVPDISSSSVLENGWPVLILDVEDMIRSIDNMLSGRRLGKLPAETVVQNVRAVKRVLIVDDSITVRELERQLLENHGYAVDVAVDGIDGWNAVRSAHYDLVVSDVDMPRMDGIQLVRQIKEDGRLKAIPVVIVSYKDREEDRIRGLDAGANSYLTKSSFHDRTFLTTVADLIGQPRE
jgi:two-component system sensor histidine kinase and response regulator WspE